LQRLEVAIALAEIVHTGGDLVRAYAEVRVACGRTGHALGQRDPRAGRWIAVTALRPGVPLVSNDRSLEGTPGLLLEAVRT
jgi:predicted nucleic acid-binding protein